jgi:hypothetical protein
MDKETEQKIRDRAYELWMQNGCLPDRADDYWYQAEREILGPDAPHASAPEDVDREIASEISSYPVLEEAHAPVETRSAPLGMTSETTDEVLPNPVAKTRRRRGAAAGEPGESGDNAGVAPKRRRSVRTP